MLKELCKYISNNDSNHTLGDNLILGEWTANDPVASSAVTDSSGRSKNWTPNRDEYRIQVLSKGQDYLTARDLSMSIYNLLKKKGQITLPVVDSGEEWIMEQVNPVSPPQLLSIDGETSPVISVNYIVHAKKI